MSSITAELLTVARLVDNWDGDATAAGKWTSTTVYQATVPATKRWFVLGGMVNRDVSGTVVIVGFNAANQEIYMLGNLAAATGRTGWPDYNVMVPPYMLVLDAGGYIKMTFGAAQSTAAAASCVVLEVDM